MLTGKKDSNACSAAVGKEKDHLKGRKVKDGKSANCISIAENKWACFSHQCHIILSWFHTNSSMSYLKFSAHFHLKEKLWVKNNLYFQQFWDSSQFEIRSAVVFKKGNFN